MGKILVSLYKKIHKDATPPYYYNYSLWTIIAKPIRKYFSAVIIPTIPFSNLRVACYRLCGYKIGKNTFIGMRCYLDDMCYDLIKIGNNVTISYGVYFACHGKGQGHNTIEIEDGAYVGMNCSIISRKEGGLIIGKNAIIGACSLVNKSIPENTTVAGVPAKIIKGS